MDRIPLKPAFLACVCVFAIIPSPLFSQSDRPAAVYDAQSLEFPLSASTLGLGTPSMILESESYDVEYFENRALQTHPLLVESWNRIIAAEGAYIQFGLQPNPEVGYNGQQIGSRGVAEQHGIQVTQQIVRHAKIVSSQAAAFAEIERLRHEWEIAKLRVQSDVRIAFTAYMSAQMRSDLANRLREIAQQTELLATQLRDAKEASKADVLQAAIESEQAILIYESAQNAKTAAWYELATLASMPLDRPYNAQGTLESDRGEIEYTQLLDILLAASPERSAAQSTITRNRFALQRARQEPRPNLTIQGLYNFRDNGIQGAPDGGILVTIPIPVWNRNQGGTQQAIGQLRASEHALLKLDLELQNRLVVVYERLATAASREKRYRDTILPASEESLQLTRIASREGEISLNRLLLAQKTYFELSLELLNARTIRKTAEIEIDGMLLRESLLSRP